MPNTLVPRESEWFDTVPRSIRGHAIFGIALLVLSFGGFGWWSFTAPLAAAVISQGSFVATGQNKIVQHLEGGIIEAIYVNEGDTVEAGEVLLSLDRTAALAAERELRFRLWRLEAIEARLMAEAEGRDKVAFPGHLLEARIEDPDVANILDGQELAFSVSRTELDNELRMLQRDIEALNIRGAGYQLQLNSHRRQLEILREEHAVQVDLRDQGLVRRSELASVQRAMIAAEGQVGRLQAEIDEIAEVKARYQAQMERAVDEFRRTALEELQSTQTESDAIRERAVAAEDVSSRVEISSPVAGTIVRLFYHTAGGVVESGKPIIEILPADAPLIVEVLVPQHEIDSVHQGQHAIVRLTALNQRTTPVLEGQIAYLSADSITSEHDGIAREVYVARVSLAPGELARIPGFVPTPGMPAEVMIQTQTRTFTQYLVKPIRDSMSRAFREE
ncbi:HlyD family type I secretion periplasmic adaptor subunit [Paracoccus rhizosphaerae]|uniref:Membrane fusion protein (MFP) family protein n=1 Tax=Paracoccus rhizosphaerae TaxID=1133347 RepID=A0ABV6CMV1_9RHOB|nr:HlyD family type I secretion periplasmic adaptor subunit [Paracoccus rhizosphaerae]